MCKHAKFLSELPDVMGARVNRNFPTNFCEGVSTYPGARSSPIGPLDCRGLLPHWIATR